MRRLLQGFLYLYLFAILFVLLLVNWRRFKDFAIYEDQGNFCHCKHSMQTNYMKVEEIATFMQTTCGENAYRKGFGQKVIGFSFFERDTAKIKERKDNKFWDYPPYFRGIKENLDLVPIFYPGWTVRVYHDLYPEDPLVEALCNYTCKYNYFDLCNVRNLPSGLLKDAGRIFPMLWRLFPTLDPQVDLYISRDLDSMITGRESAAVSEWVQSGAAIHSMRDHPNHRVPLMGGAFGSNLIFTSVRNAWRSSWEKILKDNVSYSSKTARGPDQILLEMHIWSWSMNLSMQHDSYSCKAHPGAVGFPTQRKNEELNFVGAKTHNTGISHWLWKECPEMCRRNKDWKFC